MIIYNLDLLGTAVFAITGVLVGCRRDMDLFGVMVLGFVTAIGGGTIRDMLLTGQAVFWAQDLNYLYVCLISIALGLLALKRFHRFEQPLLIMDAIGLATFTIIGVEKTQALEFAPLIAVCMGVLTGAGGGVIRDLLSGHAPLSQQKHLRHSINGRWNHVYYRNAAWGLKSAELKQNRKLWILLLLIWLELSELWKRRWMLVLKSFHLTLQVSSWNLKMTLPVSSWNLKMTLPVSDGRCAK